MSRWLQEVVSFVIGAVFGGFAALHLWVPAVLALVVLAVVNLPRFNQGRRRLYSRRRATADR